MNLENNLGENIVENVQVSNEQKLSQELDFYYKKCLLLEEQLFKSELQIKILENNNKKLNEKNSIIGKVNCNY